MQYALTGVLKSLGLVVEQNVYGESRRFVETKLVQKGCIVEKHLDWLSRVLTDT